MYNCTYFAEHQWYTGHANTQHPNPSINTLYGPVLFIVHLFKTFALYQSNTKFDKKF
jgi:hypothetical protein